MRVRILYIKRYTHTSVTRLFRGTGKLVYNNIIRLLCISIMYINQQRQVY